MSRLGLSSCPRLIVLALLPFLAGSSAYCVSLYKSYRARVLRKHLRDKLPNSIWTWRLPPPPLEDEELWQALVELFHEVDLVPWVHMYSTEIASPSPNKIISPNGYSYVHPIRGFESCGPGVARWLGVFAYMNPLSRAAQTRNGQPVVVRVMAIRDEGHDYLSIIRKTSTGPLALLSNNHCLPLFWEFALEDIVFGVFPKTGGCVDESWDCWPKNSVGDILDMMLQILEGVAFLHELNICHRDLFSTNFLVDWQPESLLSMEVAVSKPRVYIIDLEFAIEFSPDCPVEDCICTGYPLARWYPQEEYLRPYPDELDEDKPWCPFKLDLWQLAYTFTNRIEMGISDIDHLFLAMESEEPAARPTAAEAFTRLRQIVNCIPPESLLVPPICVRG